MTTGRQIDSPQIRRRADGSIDLEHYERIARRLRGDDLRAGLARMKPPIAWLVRAIGIQPSARIRAFFGS